MKKLLTIASVVVAAAAFPAVAGAEENPANAPNGTHFKSGEASCSVSGTSVSCKGFTLAGVGNTNVRADLSANYSATVVCINNGGEPRDSQAPREPSS